VAHQGLIGLLLLPALGCATSGPVVAPVAPRAPHAATFPDDPAPLPRYHSERLALSLPLPNGKQWRIDDHTRRELVATHAATSSSLLVSVFRTDALVGRNECEGFARERKIVPTGELHTLESSVEITQENFDTRIWVAIEPGPTPESPVVGHVMAFGGFLRKCYVFDFSTRVDAAGDADVLSGRLAYARARILGGLKLDELGAVPRQPPPQQTPPLPAALSPPASP
jgi:hypothetical protein